MSERQPHVSVAMIAYNHERFIGEAVRSILGQTYPDFELVIVDDGSTDGTPEIIRGMRDDRIVYLRQENQGPSEARNAALRLARGKLIAQMSSDDVAEPHRLARQMDRHADRPDAIVFSHCLFIDEEGKAIEAPALDRLFNRANWTMEATLRHLFFEGNCFLAPSALATRAAFGSVGPYNPVMLQLQDYDMWVRFLLKGYRADVVEEPLMRYRLRAHGANLSSPRRDADVRVYFEKRRLLRHFLGIDRVQRLLEIFPEAASLGYPLQDDLVPFLLAMTAFRSEPRRDSLQSFAADVLMEMMEDAASRRMLLDKARFSLPDLFRLLGEIDPFDAERLRSHVSGLQRQIDDFLESRRRRKARALREMTSGVRNFIGRR